MDAERHWYIAIVAPNTEFATAERLCGDYEVFVPSQKVVSVWKDGRRVVRERLLLRGKVFIHCTNRERLDSCKLGSVRRYMVDIAGTPDSFGRKPVAVVPDCQMEWLRFALGQSDAAVEIDNVGLQVGERVRVVRGAMAGLEGVVSYTEEGKPKLQMLIEHLGVASVKVDIADIERV